MTFPPGLFVTGTDTGVGKSVLAACLVAALRAGGRRVAAVKPVLSGLDEAAGAWPHDHDLLAAVSGAAPEDVAPLRFGPAVSPHLAAELAGTPLHGAEVVAASRRAAAGAEVAIVEGAGGLLVPLAGAYTMRDLARDLGLPLVIAARPGLGTINHTLLTVEAARAGGLDVRGVVLGPWPQHPDPMQRSNRETIAALGEVEVVTVPELPGPDQAALARAGAELPLDAWLEG